MSKAHELSEIFGDASMNYAEFSAKAAGLGITFGDVGAAGPQEEKDVFGRPLVMKDGRKRSLRIRK